MKPLSDLRCLVVDTGLFLHVARRLARDYAKVYYWSPWETAFPHFRDDLPGDGYPDITRVESVEGIEDEIDLAVFPDIGYSDLQKRLAQKMPVWGCRGADVLEARRGEFLKVLKAETDLPVPKFEKLKGVTNLRLFLADHPDQYIKVSTYRGDFETFHFRSMEEDGPILDDLAAKLGPIKENVVFYAFADIETEIEDGIDTYCIDGQWPATVMHGIENKDKSFVGSFQKMADIAPETSCVNEAFGPILAKYGYRGFFSTEVRITPDKESYFIDPTCRAPSPPSQVFCEMTANYGEIIWEGAQGKLVDPEPVAQFGVQAIFKLDRDHWNVLKIPQELDEWVKVGFSCMNDGLICVPPHPEGVSEIGWLCAIGNTVPEAIESLREKLDLMPEGVHVEFESLAKLLAEMKSAKEAGIEFSHQPIPEPASVMES